jgi:hypothetical protein
MPEPQLALAVQGQSYGPMSDEKLTVAAWKAKPCWAIISAKDRMLPPAMEESAAKRMGAVSMTLPTCHMVILEEPARLPQLSIRRQEMRSRTEKLRARLDFAISRPEASLLEMHSRGAARYT